MLDPAPQCSTKQSFPNTTGNLVFSKCLNNPWPLVVLLGVKVKLDFRTIDMSQHCTNSVSLLSLWSLQVSITIESMPQRNKPHQQTEVHFNFHVAAQGIDKQFFGPRKPRTFSVNPKYPYFVSFIKVYCSDRMLYLYREPSAIYAVFWACWSITVAPVKLHLLSLKTPWQSSTSYEVVILQENSN